MHIGRRNTLGIAIEDIPGTPLEPTHYIPYLECSLQERHTPIAETQAKGVRDAEGNMSVVGKKWGAGKIDVVLDPTTIPYWLALALGAISSAPDGGGYKHTITVNPDSAPLTATIWRDRGVGEVHFPYSVVDNIELSFADDVGKVSAEIISQYPADQARTATVEDLEYFTFRNATVSTGAGEIKVRELTLKIENGAEPIFAPGSNNVDRIGLKGFRVSGNFKLLLEDEVQLDAFTGLAKQALTITFTGDGGETIEITIPQFRIDNWTEDAGIDDLVHEGIDFVAEYDTGTNSTISAEVVNDVEEYTNVS